MTDLLNLFTIKKIIFRNSILLRNKKMHINNFFINKKIGGTHKERESSTKDEKLIITYKGKEYIYSQSVDDNYYILYSYDNLDCVSVIIFPEDNNAEIHGIGNYKSCLSRLDTNISVGSTLLKITIKMLKKYKHKFNIKQIILTDNSIKECGKKNIKLSHMLILLNGDSWYGKYGFRPIDNVSYEYNEILNKQYLNNKNIINSITIEEANIIKYIKMTKNENLIKATHKILLKNKNMLLKDFLKNLLSSYDEICNDFFKFYEKLYLDIGLISFYTLLFGLNLDV